MKPKNTSLCILLNNIEYGWLISDKSDRSDEQGHENERATFSYVTTKKHYKINS